MYSKTIPSIVGTWCVVNSYKQCARDILTIHKLLYCINFISEGNTQKELSAEYVVNSTLSFLKAVSLPNKLLLYNQSMNNCCVIWKDFELDLFLIRLRFWGYLPLIYSISNRQRMVGSSLVLFASMMVISRCQRQQ